jgi:hypothetical protein
MKQVYETPRRSNRRWYLSSAFKFKGLLWRPRRATHDFLTVGRREQSRWFACKTSYPAVYEFPIAKPQTTEPHKKPQTRMLLKWGQMGVSCPVLVAAR